MEFIGSSLLQMWFEYYARLGGVSYLHDFVNYPFHRVFPFLTLKCNGRVNQREKFLYGLYKGWWALQGWRSRDRKCAPTPNRQGTILLYYSHMWTYIFVLLAGVYAFTNLKFMYIFWILLKLLVLGGNGFVGSHICREAINRGLSVASLSRYGAFSYLWQLSVHHFNVLELLILPFWMFVDSGY